MKKRILSAVLTLVMILSFFPVMQLPASAASLPWIREMDNDPSVGKTTHDVYLRFKSDGDVGSWATGSNCDACLLAIEFPADATWGSAYDNGHASTTKLEPYGETSRLYTKYFGKNFMTNSSDYIEIWINDVDAYPASIFMDLKRLGSSRSYHGDIYCTVDGQVIVNENNWGTEGGSVQTAWYDYDWYVPLSSAKVNISATNVIKPGGTVSIPYTVTGKDSMGGDIAEPIWSNFLSTRGVVVSEKLVSATSTANFSCSGVTLDPSSKQIKVDGAAFNSAKKTQKFRIATTVGIGANPMYDSLGSPITDHKILGGTKTFYSDVITLYPGVGTINYNANGGSGSMASQNITYGTAATLAKNTFTYNPTLTFKSDIGTLDVPSVSVPASFGGWMDKTTTTFNGTTYPYYEFDAAGYANRNGDVLASSAFGNGVYDKEAMLRHYIAHGKNEYGNGSANRAAATGYFGTYPDGATVKNLAGESGGVVSLYAKWNYGTTTLPTPTTDGYTFRNWTADLMDIATLTDNLEISDTTRGTVGYNDGYALTENLIPVVGGTTFTSNMEVCGVYAYDKDGNFLKRCSSYATTHTIPYAAAFVRVEVCTKKELSFEDFKNLSLEYSVPAGTVVPVAGNQTYTANWQGHYNIRFDANGGKGGTESYVVMGSSRYSDVSWLSVSRKGYEFAGWTTEPDGTELVYGADGHCVPGSAYWDESGNWKYDGDVVVYAKWAPLPVTITAQATAGGSVTGTKTVNAGENAELLATAEDGYEFAGWYDGETPVCETENFTVENVVEDKTYTAQFKKYVCNHSHDGVEYKPWKNSKSLPSSTGNYYLATDVTISQEWTAPAGEFNLCLNGKVINLNSNHLSVKNGATLNIYDCSDAVRYYDADSTTSKWTLKSEGTSNYTTEGGVITGGSSALGGAISVSDSTLNLYGGNLAGNTASSNNGGAVYITKGTLTIDGANILGNYAYSSGGGVFANQSTVTINDGRISYNRACITDNKGGDGGGIYLSNCTTTMNGASITHNTNLYDGAGIMNSAGGTLTVNGGTISDNTTTFWGEWSDYCGGTGICNDSESTLILNDGTICDNTGVSNGGGVFNRGTFNMNGGTIEGNICVSLADNIYKGYGDGVANEAGAVFTMTDGYIGVIHNDLVQDDTCRGVYNKGAFTMTGGEIFASSDDMSSCYGLSNSSAYNADGTETSSAVANIGGNAVITGQCGYKPFAVNGTGTVNVSGNAVLTAKNVNDCKDNRSRAIYLSRGTLNISGNPELISLHDFGSSNPPDTNGIRFEPSVTVNLSGGPVITAATHIQLEGTPSEPSTHFNIVGKLEKPVSPYVVVKRIDTNLSEGAFTNGWTEYMSDADHDDYFTGPEGYGVLLYENELRLAEHAHKNIIYSAWKETDSLPTTAENYRLETDVTISETWNVPSGTTNLCLNGHKITYTGNSIAINVDNTATLNITDCKDGGMLYAESEEDFTGEAYTGIWLTGGKFTMDSGKIYVKNTYPKANVRAIVARNGASLSLSGEAIVEAYGSGAPFGLCTGSEATINISDDAYIYAENIDPSARDGRVRAVYGESGAVINIYGSPVIEAYSPSTTNAVNAIRLNGSTVAFNGTPALIAKTDSGLAAEVHCEKITDLISVNCNLENDTIYRVYKSSGYVITASENTEYNNASKFASAIDDYKVTKESDGQLYLVEVLSYTVTAQSTEGGNAEGTSTVKEGENVTFTAVADEGYEFIGWFEGETKVCDTEKFVVENVTADKTYTAKFELIKVEEPEIPEDPDEPVINKYTVTASATDGGVAEGTATVEEGESVVLTAEAYEGYEFIGWYDGTALVCETEEFVVENVKANKTYTAKFVLIEVEEPEKPETPSIPELSFDGEVLTLVDESEIALRVGVSYVGSAVFDEKNVDWDRMVYVGKKYEEINGESGYRTYENFTSQAFDKAGNYVSYVKYAIGEKVSSYYYLFTVAGEAESIVLPYLTFSDNTLTMVNDMGISATVGYAYVGAEVFNSSKVDWNRFVEVGKQYSDINTERGYEREVDITEFSKEFSINGNYVAYIKYNDPNTGKSVSKYTTFTVDLVPVVTADRGRIVVEANGNDLSKITIAYIGDRDKEITDWTSFAQASNIYKEINGDPQKQQYSNLKNTNRFGQDIDGYYAVYVRYGNEVSDKIVRYYTIYVDNTDMVVKPVAQGSQDGNISIIDEGYNILKTTIAYVGTTEKTVYDWNGFMEASNVFKDINGDPPKQQYFNIEQGKLFHQKYDGYYIVFIRYDDEGSTLSTYSTVWVDNSNAVTPEITAENGRIVLSDNGVDVQKVTIAYIGEADKEICNWTQFTTASNAYKEINGDPQKQQYHTPSDGSEFVQNLDGWYAVYIRYTDENGKAVSIYKTINVTDTALVVLPEAVANGADIVINANGCEISKVTIAYIGDEEKKITNWNEFSTASNVYKDINGDPQKQQYHNPKDAAVYTQNQVGYYAVYLRYTAGGVSNTVYSVVYVEV